MMRALPEKVLDMINSGDLELINLGCQVAFREYEADYHDLCNLIDEIKYKVVVNGEFDDILTVEEREYYYDQFGTIDLWAMKRKTDSPLLNMNITESVPGKIIYTDEYKFTYNVPTTR